MATPFVLNTQTIEIILINGDCTVPASEELTIKEACLKSNRFLNINLNKSRLERYITNERHERETQYVNWGDPSIEYANCKLFFRTTDLDYLRAVASGTHSFYDTKHFTFKSGSFINQKIPKLYSYFIVFFT